MAPPVDVYHPRFNTISIGFVRQRILITHLCVRWSQGTFVFPGFWNAIFKYLTRIFFLVRFPTCHYSHSMPTFYEFFFLFFVYPLRVFELLLSYLRAKAHRTYQNTLIRTTRRVRYLYTVYAKITINLLKTLLCFVAFEIEFYQIYKRILIKAFP